jgi:transposase
MLPRLELTEAERITFQEMSQYHPYPDYRRRALGMLALSKGHSFQLVADILGVALQTPYNWLRAWNRAGLMGLLNGHQGGAPAKLTKELLDTAEQIARSSPCTLAQIAQQIQEKHPDAPPFSLDRLSVNLKKRGLSFIRTRHSLKKTLPQKLRARTS